MLLFVDASEREGFPCSSQGQGGEAAGRQEGRISSEVAFLLFSYTLGSC